MPGVEHLGMLRWVLGSLIKNEQARENSASTSNVDVSSYNNNILEFTMECVSGFWNFLLLKENYA